MQGVDLSMLVLVHDDRLTASASLYAPLGQDDDGTTTEY